ncbi:MAG TPA: ammonium transporter [Isosphaeraceae bacterium]|jgi:Amt family ammonium transporter|nr:ammonium transporter [Isosphaeraceae bacterium]
MNRRVFTGVGLSLSLGLVLMLVAPVGPCRGDDTNKGQEAAAEPAPAAPAAPAAQDPASAPAAPDPTGASYYGPGVSTTGALTKADGKVTSQTLTQDLKLTKVSVNLLWALVAGFLVMFMQAGFAFLETGLCRAKNCAHTMAMNFMIYGIGLLGFWACGYAFQMGGAGPLPYWDGPDVLNKLAKFTLFGYEFKVIGYTGFFLTGHANDVTVLAMFLFQMVFMDTAATIPTGAMAERWKMSSFFVYGLFMSMILYPVFACWVWGGGWLSQLGVNFGLGNGHIDFAGSSVVHMTGGVTALAGAIMLGPRIGKFNKDGTPNAIPGHNLAYVVMGTLILAFGWFGFNAGSTLAATDNRFVGIAVNTMLASAAGCIAAVLYMWGVFGKPDPTMGCNGLLAGLVAITAPCAFVNPVGAVLIGTIAGVLVIMGVLFVEQILKVDDPVGAVAVHGICGAWGCLAIGLFATGEYGAGWNGVATAPLGLFFGGGFKQLLAELVGVVANFVWVFGASMIFFWIVGKTIGNRTTAQAEIEGLDIHEMGVPGYALEDPYPVRVAGEEHIATYGSGVPKVVKETGAKVPASKV